MAAAAAATKGGKRTGKENAPPVISKDVMDDGNSFDEMNEDPVKTVKPTSRSVQPTKGKAAPKGSSRDTAPADDMHTEGSAKTTSGLRAAGGSSKRVEQLEVENKRLRSQRDEYSRQFEELSNLRNTAIEKTLEKFKENMDNQGKAKDDVITSLTGLNEKLQAKIRALEKAARTDAPKADPKEIKALKELVEQANGDLAKRNTEYAELEKMYKTEQQYCQTLQASRSAAPPAPADPATSNEGSAEDAAIIRLYEDITELNVVGVKSREGKYGPKDKVMDYNCVLALTNGASINFRLRTFKELDPVKHAARARNPYDSIVQFTPELSRETDQAFIARLGKYQEEIRTTQEELPGLMRGLRRKVAGED